MLDSLSIRGCGKTLWCANFTLAAIAATEGKALIAARWKRYPSQSQA